MDSWHLWILTCPNPAHGRISGVSTISRVNTYNLSRSNWWQNIKVILLPPVPQESSFYALRANKLFYPDIIAQLLAYFQAMVQQAAFFVCSLRLQSIDNSYQNPRCCH